jgi:hypothetical protein
MSTYRPTVRYGNVFRDYIDNLFHATTLDRSQILRAALFTAAHSKEFQELLKPYRRIRDVPFPSPAWKASDHGLWLEAEYKVEKERKCVNAHGRRKNDAAVINEETSSGRNNVQENRRVGSIERQEWQIPTERVIRNATGGIKIDLRK